jgi:hypothetical protein
VHLHRRYATYHEERRLHASTWTHWIVRVRAVAVVLVGGWWGVIRCDLWSERGRACQDTHQYVRGGHAQCRSMKRKVRAACNVHVVVIVSDSEERAVFYAEVVLVLCSLSSNPLLGLVSLIQLMNIVHSGPLRANKLGLTRAIASRITRSRWSSWALLSCSVVCCLLSLRSFSLLSDTHSTRVSDILYHHSYSSHPPRQVRKRERERLRKSQKWTGKKGGTLTHHSVLHFPPHPARPSTILHCTTTVLLLPLCLVVDSTLPP